MKDDITRTIMWAENYIQDFIKNEQFDPYTALTGTETKAQRLYGECITLLQAIETSVETFRNHRDYITFKEV